VKAFARLRARGRTADVLHADAREIDYGRTFDAIVTSPPYPGLIDYHEQHRVAYELLGLDDLRELEVGAAAAGTSRAALDAYCEGIAGVLANARDALRPRARVVIVVNDRRDLYPEILDRAGLTLLERFRRHVNRRTGRRAGEFFEDVLVAHA
jgi:tRNA G10  N-methylase Trm11